jgi:hypothetical protein
MQLTPNHTDDRGPNEASHRPLEKHVTFFSNQVERVLIQFIQKKKDGREDVGFALRQGTASQY